MIPTSFTKPGPAYHSVLPNLGQLLTFAQRAEQLRQQHEYEMAVQKMKQNAQDLDKVFEYKANPILSQYQPYFNDRVSQLYKNATEYQNHPQVKQMVKNQMSDIDGELNQIKDMEKQMDNVRQQAKQNPKRYNSEFVNNELMSQLYDDKGNLKKPKDLDAAAPYKILNNPKAYNIAGLVEDYAKDIDESVKNSFNTVQQGTARYLDKIKQSSKFAKLDADGNPMYDESGRLQLEVTPAQVNKFLQDEGRAAVVQALVDEHVKAGEKNYTPADAIKKLLEGTGYFKQNLENRELLNRSDVNFNNYIGGTAQKEQDYLNTAKYFHNLIHSTPEQKDKFLGDFQTRDWQAQFEKSPEGKPASKNGYIVINYDPVNKQANDILAMIASTDPDAKNLLGNMNKEHKFYINLDNEDNALSQLNLWRNSARTEDVNQDYLRQAYEKVRGQNKGKSVADQYGLN